MDKGSTPTYPLASYMCAASRRPDLDADLQFNSEKPENPCKHKHFGEFPKCWALRSPCWVPIYPYYLGIAYAYALCRVPYIEPGCCRDCSARQSGSQAISPAFEVRSCCAVVVHSGLAWSLSKISMMCMFTQGDPGLQHGLRSDQKLPYPS